MRDSKDAMRCDELLAGRDSWPLGTPSRPPGPGLTTVRAVLALTHQTGVRLAEIAFLLLMIAGIWLVAGELELARVRLHKVRTVVAGGAIAAAGALLIIATHWGRFG